MGNFESHVCCQESLSSNGWGYIKGKATWITEYTDGSTKQDQTTEGSRIIHHGKDSSDNDVMWEWLVKMRRKTISHMHIRIVYRSNSRISWIPSSSIRYLLHNINWFNQYPDIILELPPPLSLLVKKWTVYHHTCSKRNPRLWLQKYTVLRVLKVSAGH